MKQSPSSVQQEFNLGQWALKAQVAQGNSRRFSASYIERDSEESRSLRSNRTISSTASSPGYNLREEIDPSTYSFTTALQALQARYRYKNWDCLSPDGFALNSKWNEAEKYICNPHSGEVPLECLSAKTLSARSFRNYASRTSMSAPLVYSFQSKQIQTKPCVSSVIHFTIREAKDGKSITKDVGTQSTPPELQSYSSSPISSTKIIESLPNQCEAEGRGSPNSNENMKNEKKVIENKSRNDGKREEKEEKEKEKERWRCSTQGGCLSWMTKKNKPKKKNMFLPHPINGC